MGRGRVPAGGDILLRGQTEALRRLEARLKRLSRWWRLPLAVQYLPQAALAHHGEITLLALKAPLTLVPFTGHVHTRLRDQLAAWAQGLEQSPFRTGIRVLYGPGGAGKTRTAVEVGRYLTALGWEVFFLPSEDLRSSVHQTLNLAREARTWFCPSRPTLYILDYTEHLPWPVFQTLLDVLYETAEEREVPVALLWLQRPRPEPHQVEALSAITGEDVYRSLFRYEVVRPALTHPLPVPRIREEDLPQLFDAARTTFIGLRGKTPARTVNYTTLPARSLDMVLLALLTAYGREVKGGEEFRIFQEVRTWERGKWRKYLQGLDPALPHVWLNDALDFIEVGLLVRTLGRRFPTPEALAAFWQAHTPPRARDSRGHTLSPYWLAQAVQGFFPSRMEEDEELLPAIQPDPQADFLLARHHDLLGLVRAGLALPEAEVGNFLPDRLIAVLDRLFEGGKRTDGGRRRPCSGRWNRASSEPTKACLYPRAGPGSWRAIRPFQRPSIPCAGRMCAYSWTGPGWTWPKRMPSAPRP